MSDCVYMCQVIPWLLGPSVCELSDECQDLAARVVILSWKWMWEELKEHFAENCICTCIVSVWYIFYYFITVT